jgi:hypothetical protein
MRRAVFAIAHGVVREDENRDLHALYMLAIPDRLEDRVGEAEVQEVADGGLAQ